MADAPALVAGRARFAGSVCPKHGPAADGGPCAKFGHLPGGGVGPAGVVGFGRARRSFFRVAKPLIYAAAVAFGLWLAVRSLPGLVHIVPVTMDGGL